MRNSENISHIALGTVRKQLHISRNKGNQTMKLGQLIEYNKRNIFRQISKIMQKMRQGD